MTSKQILTLLHDRHSKDLFVPECKTGPTWTGRPFRMDGFAIKRSWTKPFTTGYEIKVSRSDFTRDEKWPNYMQYCNYFWFAAPPGIIDPDELPQGVGLLVATKNANRLIAKKKAVYSEISAEIEAYKDVLFYILISRAFIERRDIINDYDKPWARRRESSRDEWEKWLQDRTADKDLGYRVSGAIADRINHVHSENRKLRGRIEQLERIERFAREAGLDQRYFSETTLKRDLESVSCGLTPQLQQDLKTLKMRIESVLKLTEDEAGRS